MVYDASNGELKRRVLPNAQWSLREIKEDISDLSRTLKTEYGLDPKNLSSKIDELKKEFNDNTQLIKENLEKLEDTDE